MASSLHDDGVTVSALADDRDAAAFRSLNEPWILEFFALEPADVASLGDPRGQIVERGGCVLMARRGAAIVGTVALIADDRAGFYQLAKMAVAPNERRRGIGRRLIEAALDDARRRGARCVYLGSSTKLAGAVPLYESCGFEHCAASELNLPYARGEVFVRLLLR